MDKRKVIKDLERRFKEKEEQRIIKLNKMNKFLFTSKSLGRTPSTNFDRETSNKWFSKGLSFNTTVHQSSSKDKIAKTFFKGGINRFVKNTEALTKAIGSKFNIINKAVLLNKDSKPNLEKGESETVKINPIQDRKVEIDETQNTHPNDCIDQEKDLTDFIKSLDFEKYMNDIKIREALRLIKLKVESENNHSDQDQSDMREETYKYNESLISKYFNDQDNEEKTENDKCKLPNIPKEKLLNEVVLIPPSDSAAEIKKKQYQEILNQLHKNVTLKTIHSTQSIMRILEREGLTTIKQSKYLRFIKFL